MQPAFTAWWRNGRTVKDVGRSQNKMDFVDKTREGTKHRTEWCATANKYRCMKCERSNKYMKMQGTCAGPRYLSKKLGRWRGDIWEDMTS